MYDYLVVGAGLFGAVFAHEAALKEKNIAEVWKNMLEMHFWLE